MREIKFRAWGGYYSMGGSPEDGGEWHYWSPLTEKFPRPWKQWESQFTGLKDKNGKEIYGGDIVLEEKPPDALPQWKPKVIVAEIPRVYFERWVNVTGEIIGNIYENPELLTPH